MSSTPFEFALTKLAEAHATTIDRVNREQAIVAANRELLAELVGRAPALPSYPYLSVDTFVERPRVVVTLTLRELASLKDQRLIDVLTLYVDAPSCETKDWTSYEANRDFHFDYAGAIVDGVKTCVRVSVAGYVKADSGTCRRVQVGVQTSVTPVYEIVCEE